MKRLETLNRIEKALLANFDEVSHHKDPYISLSLVDVFPFPKSYKAFDGEFVDELFGELQKDLSIVGMEIGISIEHEDWVERVNEILLDELDIEELENLALIAESHKGDHWGKNHKIFKTHGQD